MNPRISRWGSLQPHEEGRAELFAESAACSEVLAANGHSEAPRGHALLGRFLPDHWPEPSGSGPFQAGHATWGSWLAPLKNRGVVRGVAIGAPIATAAWGALIWLTITFGCVAAVLAISLALAAWLVVFYLVAQMGGA